MSQGGFQELLGLLAFFISDWQETESLLPSKHKDTELRLINLVGLMGVMCLFLTNYHSLQDEIH